MSRDWSASPRWLQSPRQILSAAVVVSNSAGEILLVESPRRGWEIPGGQVELNESIQLAHEATKNYVRLSSRTGVSVITDAPTGGRAITVFEGKPSPEWVPVPWRPGL